jgi:hypothetical protein
MIDLKITDNQFEEDNWVYYPVIFTNAPTKADIDLFDQNGFDQTVLEQHYTNNVPHRPHQRCIKWDWIFQTPATKMSGAVLNHSILLQRKGYKGAARQQLMIFAEINPLVHKVANIKPKWGLDFSMDYVNSLGDTFEVLHYEFDTFSYNEAHERKLAYEEKFLSVDWDHAALKILEHKDEWYNLPFTEQSAWKCEYFGIEHESFGHVCW